MATVLRTTTFWQPSHCSVSVPFSLPKTSFSIFRRKYGKPYCISQHLFNKVMVLLAQFRNFTSMHLSCSSIGDGFRCGQYTWLKFGKDDVSSFSIQKSRSHTPKVGCDFHSFRNSANCSGCILMLQSHLREGLSTTMGSSKYLHYPFQDAGFPVTSHHYGAFSRRYFSQAPKAISSNVQTSMTCEQSTGKSSLVKMFNKRWKRSKPLAAQHKKNVSGSTIKGDEGVYEVTIKQPAGDSQNNVKSKNPESGVKGKKHTRAKKSSEKSSGTKISKSMDDANTGLVREAYEEISAGSMCLEEGNGSIRTKRKCKITTGATSKDLTVNKHNTLVKSQKTPTRSSKDEEMEKHKMDSKTRLQGQQTWKPLYPPSGKSIVIVESITKAKVIQGYLGNMYEVLPSYGHVRDLAARSGSVRPDDDFSMVWEVPSSSWTHLKSIKVALRGAVNLILASDPDREGEAIAWHIIEMLRQQDALCEDITVARVVFHEITETSIKTALQAPRNIDENLVHAYLARRALDYLIGFNISPLLWRKLPGCQSAGRVQSAALALICDREMEVDEFEPQEYWSVEASFNKKKLVATVEGVSFLSHLTHFGCKKLSQLSIGSHTEAKDIERVLNSSNFQVASSKRNKTRKNPPAPYITSTLQQDAANKLHFSTTYTMKLAHKLYEGVQLSDGKVAGLITYIRTDGLHVSDGAANDIHSLVIQRYGFDSAPDSARKYFKKVKNAQEAHEAIRPTDIGRLPSMLIGILDEDSLKLYTLIWCRTMACQMEAARIDQLQVDIESTDGSIILRSSCSKMEVLGYQAVYKDVEAKPIQFKEDEGSDRDEALSVLSALTPGNSLYLGKIDLKQHHTQPPPRYSEGSLVKKLEELGIGRPSTYATILKVLQDRNYVTIKSRVLYPEFRGRMVSAFLAQYFSEVTDYSFTADMETELDNVSAGFTEWKGLLKDYWTRFSTYCSHTSNIHIHQVEKMLEKRFGDFLFASLPDKSRTCPSCMEGTLIFKVSRFGAGYFIGCNQHPKCKYIAKTLYGDDEDETTPTNSNTVEEPKLLGLHPTTNEKILLKCGPYGSYVQLGEDRKGYSPKRASVSHVKQASSLTVEDALELFRYPVTLGNHPKDGQPVILRIAKVGYSIRHRRTNAPVPKKMKPSEITLEKALKLLLGKDVKMSGRPKNKPKPSDEVGGL